MDSIASSNEVCTHFPSPVTSRSRSATRMPWARRIPAHRSATGMPTRTGPWPGMPVVLDHDVGIPHQTLEDGHPFGRAEVQRDGSLSAVQVLEVEPVAIAAHAVARAP